jgi:hypothetical protein
VAIPMKNTRLTMNDVFSAEIRMLIGRPLPIDVLHATGLVAALQVLTERVYPSMGGPWSANTRAHSACRRAQP